MKITNQRAYHEYQILDKIEAGVMLTGSEAKAVRSGRIQLVGSYVRLLNREIWLINAVIPEFEYAKLKDYQPDRTRKLLLSQQQILKLSQKIQTKGLTLVPLSAYTRKGLVKIEVGLVKGKKQYQKRETQKRKDIQRETDRTLREKQ